MKIDGIFIAQGIAGSTDFAKKLGAKIENDKIVVNENMETSIKGLFACRRLHRWVISNFNSCV